MTLREIPLEVLCEDFLTIGLHRLKHGWNMNMNMRFDSVGPVRL